MREFSTYELKLTMEADWSIGSGVGRQGSLDSLVARDVDGLPYVPASTLRGMWRDAAETVAYGLDNGTIGNWAKLVARLFGSQPAIDKNFEGPIASCLVVTDAQYPKGFGEWLTKTRKNRAKQAMVFVKPGVAIDPLTGSAKTDFLRFDETARAGAVLFATMTIDLTGDEKADAALHALALASLALLERLGGDRRRGLGACKVEIKPVETPTKTLPASLKDAIALLEKTADAPELMHKSPAPAEVVYDAAQKGAFRRFDLTLTIKSPTTIADQVLGNVVSTSSYIPGSQLLHIAAALAGRLGLSQSQIHTAIACGDLRILAAHPSLPDGSRALPAPLTVEGKKGEDGQYRNKLADPETGAQHKALRGVYCSAISKGGFVKANALRTKLYTHNTVDDARQKPTEESGGGVFVLEAIEPGEVLKSELWIRTGAAIANDKIAALSGKAIPFTLGRAKKAGSGRVDVTLGKEISTSAPAANENTRLWVISDIVMPAGETKVDDAVAMLFKQAGLGSVMLDAKSEIRIARRDGWVAAWGMPRPTLNVICAGSVIVLESALGAEQLEQLAKDGLGDRRGEGFGHVLVNPDLLYAKDDALKALQAKRSNTETASTDSLDADIASALNDDHVRTIEIEALNALVEAHAGRAVVDAEQRKNIFEIGRAHV